MTNTEGNEDEFANDPDDLVNQYESCGNALNKAYLEDELCPDCRDVE